MQHIEEAINARRADVKERMKAAHVRAKYIVKNMRLMHHGGLAINKLTSGVVYCDMDVPDIDVFTSKGKSSKKTAHAIAHIMRREGVTNVRVVPAIHKYTHSVRIDRGVVVDVTWIPHDALQALRYWARAETGETDVAPSMYLKMSMHMELCRPAVYIERWTKVWPRLSALYDKFPFCVPYGLEAKNEHPLEELDLNGADRIIIAAASKLRLPVAGRQAVTALTGSDILKAWPLDIVIPNDNVAIEELCSECGLEVVAGPSPKNPFTPQYLRLSRDGDYVARAHVISTEVCSAYGPEGNYYGSSDLVLHLLYGEFIRTPGPYGATHACLAKAIDAVVTSQILHNGEGGVHKRFTPFNKAPARDAKAGKHQTSSLLIAD